MNIVLLQEKLTESEINKLLAEFPQYLFLAPSEVSYQKLGKEEWSRIEVIYGNKLAEEELEKAHQLRWIHSPTPHISPLCLDAIEERGNILVTSTKEENSAQIGEYVLGGVLAFAKNLFHFRDVDKNPMILWDSKWRDSMWKIGDKIFLQIGLGTVGSEIARVAKQMQMRVFGVRKHRSFHPHCHKVFVYQELHSVLPNVDIVCVALPRSEQKRGWFAKQEFKLMKEDSILVITGSKELIDEEALSVIANETNKFRGILFDAFYQLPISPKSPLWKIENILITPEVGPRPRSIEKESYRLFRYNLRQYLHSNFTDMRNIVRTKRISY